MNKRLLFYTLPGILLIVSTMMAQDTFDFNGTAVNLDPASSDTGWIHNGNSGRPIFAGVQLGTSNVRYWDGSWQPISGIAGSGSTYNLGGATIDIDVTASGLVMGKSLAGVVTNDTNGIFNLGNIVIKGGVESLDGTHSLYGFLYLDNNPFVGTINGNSNVTVDASEGEIVGVYFRKAAGGKADIATNDHIRFGDITANTQGTTMGDNITTWGDTATGFSAGNVASGAQITLGKVTAHSNADMAAGVEFTGNFAGDLAVDAIDVEGNSTFGASYGLNLHGTSNTGTISVGKIDVLSKQGAHGIYSAGGVNLILNDAITVIGGEGNGADDNTSGIKIEGGHANITLGNNVTIATTPNLSGIWNGADIQMRGASNDLSINLNGYNLTTSKVIADNNVTIKGDGRANLGIVNVGNDFTIGDGADNTTVAVDGVKMFDAGGWLGNVKFDSPNSRLEIYGNTNQTLDIGILDSSSSAGQIVNKSMFTKWGVDGTGLIKSLGMRDRVYANDNYLAAGMIHHKYTAWNAVRNHLISGNSQAGQKYGYYGQSPCDCIDSCGNSCKPTKPRSAWGNYIGRDAHYRSSFNNNDWRLSTNGVQIGTDFFRSYKTQIGAFFGYEDSVGKNLGDRVTAKDYYIGMYGVHVFNTGADLCTVFGYGWQDFNSRRNGADRNLYRTSFDGNTTELTVELGKRHYCGGYFGAWSARPAIAVDWYLNQLGGGVETPGDQAIRYHKTDFSQLFFRFGSDLRYECGRWTAEGGLFYSYDMRGGDFWARASDAATGDFTSRFVSSKLGRSVLTFNAGSSYQVSHNFSVFGGYRGEVTPEQAGKGYIHTGYVGGAWRW